MIAAERQGFELHFRRSCDVLERACADLSFLATLIAIADLLARTFVQGGKLLLAGNGGSAADAQHIAAELVGRFQRDRASLPALALGSDPAVLTAIGNDFGFDEVFARQVTAFGRQGDVLMGISTSGRSGNVLAALRVARERGLTTIGLTGSAAPSEFRRCDLLLAAPSDVTALIQQVHLVAAHAICDYVERTLKTPASLPETGEKPGWDAG